MTSQSFNWAQQQSTVAAAAAAAAQLQQQMLASAAAAGSASSSSSLQAQSSQIQVVYEPVEQSKAKVEADATNRPEMNATRSET